MVDQLDVLREPIGALAGRPLLDAPHRLVGRGAAGAEPHLEAAGAGVVDGLGLLGEQRGRAETIAPTSKPMRTRVVAAAMATSVDQPSNHGWPGRCGFVKWSQLHSVSTPPSSSRLQRDSKSAQGSFGRTSAPNRSRWDPGVVAYRDARAVGVAALISSTHRPA